MWPPPRQQNNVMPIQPSSSHFGMIPPHQLIHPPDPYIDRRVIGANGVHISGPQWNYREVGNWRIPGEDWRNAPMHQPWSNHDIYRRQYGGNIPMGTRSFSQFDRRPGSPLIKPSLLETPQIDYEKQLREHYETQKPYNDFSEMTQAAAAPLEDERKKIVLNSLPSARRINLNWKLPVLPANDKFKINLSVKLEELEGGIGRGAKSGELGLILDKVIPIHSTKTYFDAIPGSLYSIELNIIGQKGNVFATSRHKERAIFSIDEMMVLLQKAIDFTGTPMQSFTFLYRCKPRIYWDYVYETGQILNVYLKDSNGQAACPLNQNIEGLFFSAKTNLDGTLPNSSPFGDVRMVLPANNLLDPQRVNLYFADFYCNRVPHYVTVVVVVKDSKVDKFCKEKLLPLDPFDNQFLLLQYSSNPQCSLNYFVNKKVWVEIYYTENVPMRWGRFDNIIPQGVGTSKIGGLPHNKNCRVCNLYPVGVPAPPQNNYENNLLNKEQLIKEAINAKLPDDGIDDNLNNESSSSLRFISYEFLQRRYERLKHAIGSDFKNGELSNFDYEKYELLTEEINQFLILMNKDFIYLNEKIDKLREEDNKEIIKLATVEECPISKTLKSVVEEVVITSPLKEEELNQNNFRRTRKLSIDSSIIENKRRRKRREDSI